MRTLILAASALATALVGTVPVAHADPWGRGWERHHHRDRGIDGGDVLLGGAVGLAAGALLGSALSRPAPVYRDRYEPDYGRPVYARPSYAEPIYVEPPTYEDTIPQRVYREAPRRAYYDRGDHVEACYARYRSYDERSDTFLGYDGYRHRCDL